MAYTINLTDGTVFATVNDGTVNTSSSVTLVGKNYAGYGEFLDENFIQMLENFSNATAPASPLTGQIWWDKTNTLLKVYNGTIWKTISAATASATQPTSNVTGDLWYDTVNQQVKVYTGTSFLVVGPAYSSTTGTAGAIPETILDSGSVSHYVTSLYVANTRVAIFSSDSTFTAAAPTSTNFPTVYKGVTFTNTSGTNMAGNIIGGSNVIITAGGNTTATITSTGANITGYGNITGNISGGNILTIGLISATSNITSAANISGANVLVSSNVSVTGNIIAGNVIANIISPAGSNVSTTGNVTGGNILTGGLASVTGNITGGNILTGGLISATGNITSAANISAANILASVNISATANITGSYVFGNGSGLTGVIAVSGAATKLLNGTSFANIASLDGNITMAVGGTAVVTIDTTTLYATNLSATGTIRASGLISATGAITGANLFTGGLISATANITGGNLLTGGLISATGAITGASLTVSTGNISGGNINNNNGNGVGNIGSSTTYFNRLFATATTALYADVAERFAADAVLDAGTVVELGGSAEITKSLTELSDKVFGVISTRAAYLMNGGAGEDNTHPPVAMTGRVPVKVIGIVHKGDRLVSAGNGIARAARPGEANAFNVIGRSLVDKINSDSATIEAIVTIKN
jgi:hypothetical protein